MCSEDLRRMDPSSVWSDLPDGPQEARKVTFVVNVGFNTTRFNINVEGHEHMTMMELSNLIHDKLLDQIIADPAAIISTIQFVVQKEYHIE